MGGWRSGSGRMALILKILIIFFFFQNLDELLLDNGESFRLTPIELLDNLTRSLPNSSFETETNISTSISTDSTDTSTSTDTTKFIDMSTLTQDTKPTTEIPFQGNTIFNKFSEQTRQTSEIQLQTSTIYEAIDQQMTVLPTTEKPFYETSTIFEALEPESFATIQTRMPQILSTQIGTTAKAKVTTSTLRSIFGPTITAEVATNYKPKVTTTATVTAVSATQLMQTGTTHNALQGFTSFDITTTQTPNDYRTTTSQIFSTTTEPKFTRSPWTNFLKPSSSAVLPMHFESSLTTSTTTRPPIGTTSTPFDRTTISRKDLQQKEVCSK